MKKVVWICTCFLLASCAGINSESLGDNSLACIRAEGAGLFTVFSGYAETRIVHIPAALQESMGIEDLLQFSEACWLEGNQAVMLEMLRAQRVDPSG